MKKTHESKERIIKFYLCVCVSVLCVTQQHMYDTHYVLSQRNKECRVHYTFQLLFQRHFMMLSLEEREGRGIHHHLDLDHDHNNNNNNKKNYSSKIEYILMYVSRVGLLLLMVGLGLLL